MPELPEVQTVVDGLNSFVKNQEIKKVWTDYNSSYYYGKKNIKDPVFFKYFKKNILKQKIIKIQRRAKYILLFLSNGKIILVHLKMTGHFLFGDFIYSKKDNQYKPKNSESSLADPFNRFIHFVLEFKNGKYLVLSDMRRFATISLIDKKEYDEIDKKLGPEPFGIKVENLNLKRFAKQKIKTALINQEFIAGIGNIYSDEILWEVGISPMRLVKNITKKEWSNILKTAEKIFRQSLLLGGDSMSDFRNIFGEKGGFQKKHNCYKLENTKCKKPKCNGILQKIIIGGRTARFCPKHQK